MEKIPVRIRIHTRQTVDGAAQSFTFREKGYLYRKESALYLTYRETGEDGGTGTQTVWKIEPLQASLIRQGATGIRVLFKTGTADSTTLVTAHGTFPVEIDTYRLEHDLSPKGGRLRLAYKMDMAGAVSRMEVELQIHPAGKVPVE